MTSETLTQEYLKEILDYNLDTGIFTWKVSRNADKKGKIAGTTYKGYIRIMIDGKSYRAHRLVFLYINGSSPEYQIDHKNHIRSDNRFSNLRTCNNKENHKNRTLNKNNKSGVVGVHWRDSKQRWVAQISNDEKREHLGYFKEKNHAIIARWLAEDKYEYHENHGV